MRFDCLVTLSDLVFHRILAGARACPPLARPAGSCAARASPSPSLVLSLDPYGDEVQIGINWVLEY